MLGTSLVKNLDFRKLKKLFGEENAVGCFTSKGKFNFYGKTITGLLEKIDQLTKKVNQHILLN